MKNNYLKTTLYILILFIVGCNSRPEKKSDKEIIVPLGLAKISVKGNKFVTDNGTAIVFRGLNTSDPDKLDKDGHWDLDYFQEMSDWGATITRFPVHPKAWRDRGKEVYLKLLDDGIKWATQVGTHVIIDWHSIGNLKDNKYFKPGYETSMEETEEFWRIMADRYKNDNTVAFFELFNEPTTFNGTLGECSWVEWKNIMEHLIGIIRENGCETIPLVTGFDWGYNLSPLKLNPLAVENIGYVSHPYPQKREKPWESKWTDDWGFAAEKYPLILSEMGFCGPEEKGAHIPVISDESYGDAITKYADERGISYTVWVFDPDWAPMLFTDWNYSPTRQGVYFKNALQSYHN